MKISSGWEQSVFTLLILSRLPEEKYMNAAILAKRLEVSPTYLKKLLKLLVDEDLINSIRGKDGGFSLAVPIEKIDFYQVFIAIEGHGKTFFSRHFLAKFLGKKREEIKNCAITNTLDIVENTLKITMSSITLEQLEQEILRDYDMEDLDDWIAKNV